MSSRLIPPSPSWRSLVPWVGGLSVVALALGLHLGSPTGLWANSGISAGALVPIGPVDGDGDGLLDILEQVLWLDQDRADSDRDGFEDAEEVARGSDPKDVNSIPSDQEIGLAVKGYSIEGQVHVVLAIYQRGGVGGDHMFNLSAVVGGREVPLTPRDYVPHTRITVVQGANPQDTIHLLDMDLPARVLRDMGELAFALRGAPAGETEVTDAAALSLTTTSGSPYSVGLSPISGGNVPLAGGAAYVVPRSTIYTSLVPPARDSASATSGKVCVQRTRVIGSGGPSILLEVVQGFCQDADGVCPSTCTTSPGTTLSVVDPLALIGG